MAERDAADEIVAEFDVLTSDAMHEFGLRMGTLLTRGDLVVLTGPLGAGKTTLARGLGESLDVRGPVSSPTFVLARTHPSLVGGPPLIHVDAYRLSDALDLDDLDLDLAASVTIIEWGRDVVSAIADAWLDVEIERPRAGAVPDGELSVEAPRTVRVRAIGARWAEPSAREAIRALAGEDLIPPSPAA